MDNATILALRHCQIADRETFVGLDDTAEGLKSLAMDMGINLDAGGMPRRREFARISTAWKKAKEQLEVKTSTEASQRQHGERTTMLPEDWTSVIVQFEKKYGADLQDEELPSQYYCEDFQERLSAGMLCAEPLDQVISMAEGMLLRCAEDPEFGLGKFALGVRVGPGVRMPRLPALKRKWRLASQPDPLDYLEEDASTETTWRRNCASIGELTEQVVDVMEDQARRGQMIKLNEEAKARFPNLVVASLGANR